MTELFSGATDLLHGFKKFLPDNSTQPVPRARLSDRDSEERSTFRDRDEALSARQEFLHHHHPIAQETQRRQPPMGVFNPPITGAKEGKKRNRTAGAGHTNHDKSRDEIKELETPRLMNNLTNNSNKVCLPFSNPRCIDGILHQKKKVQSLPNLSKFRRLLGDPNGF